MCEELKGVVKQKNLQWCYQSPWDSDLGVSSCCPDHLFHVTAVVPGWKSGLYGCHEVEKLVHTGSTLEDTVWF